MKNKLFRYISFLAAIIFVMGACEKTDIQKANDEYDFSKVIPVVQGIAGATVATQTFTLTYSVNYLRGGSTWAWSAANATIASVSDDTQEIEVTFTDAGEAVITVTETTLAGVTSDPFDLIVTVEAFCLYAAADYEGNYTGTSSDHSDPVVFTATDVLNEFTVYNLADFVSSGWGESWVTGDGTCTGSFFCDDIFTIPKQVVGETDYPDTYSVEGSGTVDPVTKTITLDFTVFYSTGDIGSQQTILTKNSSKGGYVISKTSTVGPKKK